MTRKEPQFSDDLNTPIAVAETTDLARLISVRMSRDTHVTQAIELELVIVVIRCGELMCFVCNGIFGLEEADLVSAALTQTESQARELESTLDRLNDAQAQGIGELAQSDAQMRKMVQFVEARLKSDVTRDLDALTKQVKSVQQGVETSQVAGKEFGVVGKKSNRSNRN